MHDPATRPEVAHLPGGEWPLGDLWGDGEPDELPVHPERIAPFGIGRCTVTNAEFAEFLNATALGVAPAAGGTANLRARDGGLLLDGDTVRVRAGRERWPATYVTYDGARRYCQWLGERTAASFRLPTEAEWQYASAGPQRLKWSLGSEFRRADYVCGREAPEPVDWGAPSEFGLHNMTGNVFEWVQDEYSFSLSPEREILPGNRVIKGGAFILSESANLRNARRFSCDERSALGCIGFRIVQDLTDR